MPSTQSILYNDAILSIYNNKSINNRICKVVPYQLQGDMMSHLFIILAKMDQEKLEELYLNNRLVPYIMDMIYKQLSPKCNNCFRQIYFSKNIPTNEMDLENIDIKEDISDILYKIDKEEKIKKIYDQLRHAQPWKVRAFEYYYFAGLNFRETSEEMKINQSTIQRWVHHILSDIKKNIDKNDNN